MKTFGKKPDGLCLERMRASPLWAGDGLCNRHPIAAGLRDVDSGRPAPAQGDAPAVPLPKSMPSPLD